MGHILSQHTPMQVALEEAKKAALLGEVPVGAVLVHAQSGEIVMATHNLCETNHDPTAHAELLAIKQFSALSQQQRLSDYDLYVTLEPCAMCAAAISFARIRRLYFGAYDPKSGGVDHGAQFYNQKTCHHKPDVYGGIMEQHCATLITDFFERLRQ